MLHDIAEVRVNEAIGDWHIYSVLVGYQNTTRESVNDAVYSRMHVQVKELNREGLPIVYSVFGIVYASTLYDAIELRETMLKSALDMQGE